MTQEEIRAHSAAKVKQLMDLSKSLHVRVVAKERITEDGTIENTVFYIDEEKYEMEPVVTIPPAPTGETGSNV